MKRLAFRSAVALLTFIVGVSVATLLIYRRDSSPLSQIEVSARTQSANQPGPAQSPEPARDDWESLEADYIEGDRLSYAGYDVERSFDAVTKVSSAMIRKNGKTLAAHMNGWFIEDTTEIGLFSFLGGGTKQLFIMQYTGGAHCCWVYKVYDFSPHLRLIFDGEKYGIDSIGNEMRRRDVDGDGVYELTQAVMTFDYFHMSHASSVFPTAVFSYDEKKRAYAPANHKFTSYLLEGVEEDLKRVEEERGKIEPDNESEIANEKYLSAVLRVMLKYIYAGREADGWEFYNREYNLSNKGEIKADIRKALQTDPIYQSIYRRGAA